jgi:uncharacterized iron-regulated protein
MNFSFKPMAQHYGLLALILFTMAFITPGVAGEVDIEAPQAPPLAQPAPPLASPLAPPQVFQQSKRVEMAAVWADLKAAQVVYLGETHDSEADHQAQQQIIKTLITGPKPLILAMEMFQTPFQGAIDRYLTDETTEAQFLTESEYEARWGFPWALYQPIFALAKTQRLPVFALNTPREITRQVARRGLESLSPEQKSLIPKEIELGPESYRQAIQAIYAQHQPQGNSQGIDRFFQAMVLWDETMADGIAQLLGRFPDRQIVVLVGQGHIINRYGIPDRVARRHRGITQRTILLNPPTEVGEADYSWITPSSEKDK